MDKKTFDELMRKTYGPSLSVKPMKCKCGYETFDILRFCDHVTEKNRGFVYGRGIKADHYRIDVHGGE